ncbi:winged helix-turn-helix transcriptional regulator [Paenibacillus sp. SYP-B3998]|uniref:Winged helix-turn-helix transcriptional regulator n=1 Tax=Paenibacillus sp. SYP-B3998 TaxID=2678564 RepID=A0A6G4A0Y6_9BACL|nr:carbohydrate kinase [Paenibacillus sp. SYP-B3998]NEW07958.1 winged helix-turn-helix transcriptional regulator [Paenibacillus sp. SYP-B3998]
MDREQQILALIRQNPFISQHEMANAIGISRSAIAGYIASLMKKGVLRGRAYVTADDNTVMCIGGANLDNKATSKQAIRLASSNPVTVAESCGGVARNIAETLANLSCQTALLTVVGDDKAGQWVLEETKKRGVEVSQSIVLQGEKTGTYTALLDATGEMFLAFANMEIYDKCSPALLREKWPHIAASKLVIADTNLPSDTLDELVKRCGEEGVSLFIDPVSSEKAKKLPRHLQGVTAIFPNLEEACQLAGVSISTEPDIAKLAEAIRERGVEHVFITLGSRGVMYSGQTGSKHFAPIPTQVVEVTGAGDAFLAGIAYGVLHNQSYIEACSYGLAAAHITLQTADSVASELNEERLIQTITTIKGD